MSRRTILHIEFLNLLTTSILLGASLFLSFQKWVNGSVPLLWAGLTVFFVAAVVFDAHRTLKGLSPNSSQPKKGVLIRLIGTVFVAAVAGINITQGFESWLRDDAIFWPQLASA
jgi:hypothetical protein